MQNLERHSLSGQWKCRTGTWEWVFSYLLHPQGFVSLTLVPALMLREEVSEQLRLKKCQEQREEIEEACKEIAAIFWTREVKCWDSREASRLLGLSISLPSLTHSLFFFGRPQGQPSCLSFFMLKLPPHPFVIFFHKTSCRDNYAFHKFLLPQMSKGKTLVLVFCFFGFFGGGGIYH